MDIETDKGILTADTEEDFHLFYRPTAELYDRGFHAHPCWEIHFFCQDTLGDFHFEDRDYSINPGDVFLIPPFTYHNSAPVSSRRHYSSYMLCLSNVFLQWLAEIDPEIMEIFTYIQDSRRYQIRFGDIEQVQAIFQSLNKLFLEYEQDNICKRTQVRILLIAFLTQLNRQFFSRSRNANIHTRKNLLLEKLVGYIQENYHLPITLKSAAECFFLSQATIENLFTKKLGKSFYCYVTDYRLEMAKSMIQQGSSLSHTAQSCGFPDYSNFYRVFVKRLGISPSAYAASARTEAPASQMQLAKES